MLYSKLHISPRLFEGQGCLGCLNSCLDLNERFRGDIRVEDRINFINHISWHNSLPHCPSQEYGFQDYEKGPREILYPQKDKAQKKNLRTQGEQQPPSAKDLLAKRPSSSWVEHGLGNATITMKRIRVSISLLQSRKSFRVQHLLNQRYKNETEIHQIKILTLVEISRKFAQLDRKT